MSKLMQKLNTLRSHGILEDIDLELCRFLGDRDPEISDEILLSACLVSYLYRQGDVCLMLEKYASQTLFEESDEDLHIQAPASDIWEKALLDSEVVGHPGDFKPLILDDGGRLYLHKLWHYENVLARQLINRSQQTTGDIDRALLKEGLDRLFPNNGSGVDWQKVAAAAAVKNKLSVISGGPGTGKTSTVVRVLALLLEQAAQEEQNISIALAAPTGKAAGRLKESISSAKEALNVDEEIRETIPEDTMTLHQLLGARRYSSSFRHDEDNPVPYDLVIVDEASMVDQVLMSKLVNAMLEKTQLILLGDKDQLASVEAGSVLGDICSLESNRFSSDMADWLRELSLAISEDSVAKDVKPLTDHITLLTKSYRFGADSGIARLADCVNNGDADQSLEVLRSGSLTDVTLASIDDTTQLEQVLRENVAGYFENIIQSESVEMALQRLNEFQILAAHRRGPWGIEFLNRYVEQILQQEGLLPKYQQWYTGKPVIINVNDYTLGLHNGDTGLCMPDAQGELKIHFRHEDTIRSIAPGRLPDHNTAFALTVHKSQGSEFNRVLLVLPDKVSQVLSRELVYTAVTRARTAISILGRESVLRKTIHKRLQRSSGLRDRLWGKSNAF